MEKNEETNYISPVAARIEVNCGRRIAALIAHHCLSATN